MQYTVRDIPKRVDSALRKQAKRRGKSLNQIALEALSRAAGLCELVRYRNLDWLAGTWVHDPEFDKIIEEQRQIDPEMWK
jgi:hypothetical protein